MILSGLVKRFPKTSSSFTNDESFHPYFLVLDRAVVRSFDGLLLIGSLSLSESGALSRRCKIRLEGP